MGSGDTIACVLLVLVFCSLLSSLATFSMNTMALVLHVPCCVCVSSRKLVKALSILDKSITLMTQQRLFPLVLITVLPCCINCPFSNFH